jgi:hypothetical protein
MPPFKLGIFLLLNRRCPVVWIRTDVRDLFADPEVQNTTFLQRNVKSSLNFVLSLKTIFNCDKVTGSVLLRKKSIILKKNIYGNVLSFSLFLLEGSLKTGSVSVLWIWIRIHQLK